MLKRVIPLLFFFLFLAIPFSYAASPTIPNANILNYIQVTITNPSSIAYGANTPIFLGVNNANSIIGIPFNSFSTYLTTSANNLVVFYGNGTIIKSWMEGNYLNEQSDALSTSPNVVIAINLGANTANELCGSCSYNNIYLGLAGTTATPANLLLSGTTGEAPQLSCPTPTATNLCTGGIYGQFDNGNQIFNPGGNEGYWNFSGTVLPSAFINKNGGTNTIDNGISIISTGGSGCNAAGIETTATFGTYNAVTAYGSVAFGAPSIYSIEGFANSNNWAGSSGCGSPNAWLGSDGGSGQIVEKGATFTATGYTFSTNSLWTVLNYPATANALTNYKHLATATNTMVVPPNSIELGESQATAKTFIQYAMVYALPTCNCMASTSYGAVTAVTTAVASDVYQISPVSGNVYQNSNTLFSQEIWATTSGYVKAWVGNTSISGSWVSNTVTNYQPYNALFTSTNSLGGSVASGAVYQNTRFGTLYITACVIALNAFSASYGLTNNPSTVFTTPAVALSVTSELYSFTIPYNWYYGFTYTTATFNAIGISFYQNQQTNITQTVVISPSGYYEFLYSSNTEFYSTNLISNGVSTGAQGANGISYTCGTGLSCNTITNTIYNLNLSAKGYVGNVVCGAGTVCNYAGNVVTVNGLVANTILYDLPLAYNPSNNTVYLNYNSPALYLSGNYLSVNIANPAKRNTYITMDLNIFMLEGIIPLLIGIILAYMYVAESNKRKEEKDTMFMYIWLFFAFIMFITSFYLFSLVISSNTAGTLTNSSINVTTTYTYGTGSDLQGLGAPVGIAFVAIMLLVVFRAVYSMWRESQEI